MWAALRSLGRSGVADLVGRALPRRPRFADGLAAIPGVRVLNDVVYTQVSVGFASDELRDRASSGGCWRTARPG